MIGLSQRYEELPYYLRTDADDILRKFDTLLMAWKLVLADPPETMVIEYEVVDRIIGVVWTLVRNFGDQRQSFQLYVSSIVFLGPDWRRYQRHMYWQVIQSYAEAAFPFSEVE